MVSKVEGGGLPGFGVQRGKLDLFWEVKWTFSF
jgi:hypothetical protein